MDFEDLADKLLLMWEKTYKQNNWEANVAVIDRMIEVVVRDKYGPRQIGFTHED